MQHPTSFSSERVVRSGSEPHTVHLDSGAVENRGQYGPGGSLSLLGDSRVATNIRGFFANRLGNALPDTGWRESLLALPKKWLSGTPLVHTSSESAKDANVVLPKLPIPSLEQTLTKYEKTLQPILDESKQERLKKLIENFGSPAGIGPRLQLHLIDKSEKLDNWAYKYWLNDMYLGNRAALPVNSNPGYLLPPRKFTTILDVARFAARIVDAALAHKAILDRRALPIERATSREPGQPLCMSQYYNLLGTTRLPGRNVDSQYIPLPPKEGENPPEHVVVICRNQFYCIPVQAADRGRLNEDELCAQLLNILDDAPCLASAPPVGLLTGWKRHKWWEAREILQKDDRNRRNLELIDKSLLIICLDEPLPTSFNVRNHRGGEGHTAGGRDETNLFLQILHGGGSTYNSSNRWFDKTLQFIISGDGVCGVCNEHSLSEGVVVVQLIEKCLKHIESLPNNTEVPTAFTSHLPPPERLEWVLEQEDHKRIEEAAVELDNLIKDLDYQVYRYEGYGKDFIKSCHISPDVFIQLALQLAYYKLNGKLTATYESASTRRFRMGRVDCIRSATPEALNWVTSMTQPKEGDDLGNKKVTFQLASDSDVSELWNAAVKEQTKEMIDNILGQGIDIHLLGLREAAKDTAPTAMSQLPELFTDETYRLANSFLLSTSQVATSTDSIVGYGPVEPNGYGASYNPKPKSIVFGISAFWSSQTTSTSRFTQALEESLNSIQQLLTRIRQNGN
ncbi:hypothetical protein PPYR_05967 [Photinus pyralis]|uniref:Choline O-acetyltransferase n=1 Tax=Photinus pyralis TaxID=7054 RepID=A0A5N4ASB3_PHOPY|nr:hypothetical protein PPYR_05967 [Photinus pyralis]